VCVRVIWVGGGLPRFLRLGVSSEGGPVGALECVSWSPSLPGGGWGIRVEFLWLLERGFPAKRVRGLLYPFIKTTVIHEGGVLVVLFSRGGRGRCVSFTHAGGGLWRGGSWRLGGFGGGVSGGFMRVFCGWRQVYKGLGAEARGL